MNFELSQIFGIGLLYLSMLFAVAWAAERGWISHRITRHPVVYILALGVIAGSWSFFGMVDMAARYGFSYLSYFFGISVLFLFGSLILSPLMRVARLYQLRSLPDILAFRFRSQLVGMAVTIFMVLSLLPLFALQITAVADSILILTDASFEIFPGDNRQSGVAFVFCCVVTLFTVLFGARHVGGSRRHDGLIAAIAFESISKLVVLLIISGVIVFQVFGGFGGLQDWLSDNQHIVHSLRSIQDGGDVRYFLLLFFAAAVLMPHSFHIMFYEQPTPSAVRAAAWGFPLYMFALSVPVLLILWGSQSLGIGVPVQYATLGIGISLEAPQLQLLAYLGGLSAASSVIIVATLALASMCLNHLVLAIYQPDTSNIYQWLLWARRVLIVGIILMSYLFYRVVSGQHDLASLGIAAFSGGLHFLPGLLATLYWPESNRVGFILGLCGGMIMWFFLVLLPMLQPDTLLLLENMIPETIAAPVGWRAGTLAALGMNILLFILGSMLTRQSEEETLAAEICSTDELSRPVRRALDVHSPAEMRERLTSAVGRETAERELSNALYDLGMESTESRPYALRRLRERIEANLSGLLGPSTAYEIINRQLPFVTNDSIAPTEDIQFIESRLENTQVKLTGLAAELDSLRRYHRETLQSLPIAVCVVGYDREVIMWNQAMVSLTDVNAEQVIGSSIDALPLPWSNVLTEFAEAPHQHVYKKHISVMQHDRWISLHKTLLQSLDQQSNSQAIVIEDLTENQLLEQELTHSERLASVGRLAAGVAHEIGNPVTGIACLAQNLSSEFDDPDIRDSAKDILEQTRRVSRIVQTLVNFAHAGGQSSRLDEPIHIEPVDLKACVNDAIALLKLNKDAREMNWQLDIDADTLVAGDPQRLAQVFINLFSNARDASESGGNILISSRQDPHSVDIDIIDNGSGISRELQARIFEPFFTTKQAGEGTGLGLALVYSIIEDHHGSIHFESPVNHATERGTKVSLRLPRYQ